MLTHLCCSHGCSSHRWCRKNTDMDDSGTAVRALRQGLSSDGDVLLAPQLMSESASRPQGSLEQALLLGRALQVIKVRVGAWCTMCRAADRGLACQPAPEVMSVSGAASAAERGSTLT